MNAVNSCNKGMFMENIVPFIAAYFAFLLLQMIIGYGVGVLITPG